MTKYLLTFKEVGLLGRQCGCGICVRERVRRDWQELVK